MPRSPAHRAVNPTDYGLVVGTGKDQATQHANTLALRAAATAAAGRTLVLPAGTIECFVDYTDTVFDPQFPTEDAFAGVSIITLARATRICGPGPDSCIIDVYPKDITPWIGRYNQFQADGTTRRRPFWCIWIGVSNKKPDAWQRFSFSGFTLNGPNVYPEDEVDETMEQCVALHWEKGSTFSARWQNNKIRVVGWGRQFRRSGGGFLTNIDCETIDGYEGSSFQEGTETDTITSPDQTLLHLIRGSYVNRRESVAGGSTQAIHWYISPNVSWKAEDTYFGYTGRFGTYHNGDTDVAAQLAQADQCIYEHCTFQTENSGAVFNDCTFTGAVTNQPIHWHGLLECHRCTFDWQTTIANGHNDANSLFDTCTITLRKLITVGHVGTSTRFVDCTFTWPSGADASLIQSAVSSFDGLIEFERCTFTDEGGTSAFPFEMDALANATQARWRFTDCEFAMRRPWFASPNGGPVAVEFIGTNLMDGLNLASNWITSDASLRAGVQGVQPTFSNFTGTPYWP